MVEQLNRERVDGGRSERHGRLGEIGDAVGAGRRYREDEALDALLNDLVEVPKTNDEAAEHGRQRERVGRSFRSLACSPTTLGTSGFTLSSIVHGLTSSCSAIPPSNCPHRVRLTSRVRPPVAVPTLSRRGSRRDRRPLCRGPPSPSGRTFSSPSTPTRHFEPAWRHLIRDGQPKSLDEIAVAGGGRLVEST